MRHRTALAAAVILLVVTAGCAVDAPGPSTPSPAASGTPTAPSGSVDFPPGPKDPPARPAVSNASAVREYVRAYEYRYAYNSLWANENSTVRLVCRVDDVTRRPWGHEAVVTCTGSSETDGLNADWFTQSYRYRVSETATNRTRVETREPVA